MCANSLETQISSSPKPRLRIGRLIYVYLLGLLMLTACSSIHRIPEVGGSSPKVNKLTDELIAGLNSGEVYAVASLNPGKFPLSEQIQLRVQPGTQLAASVVYSNRLVTHAKFEFTHPVYLRYKPFPEIQVRHIDVTDAGDVRSDLTFHSPIVTALVPFAAAAVKSFLHNKIGIEEDLFQLAHGKVLRIDADTSTTGADDRGASGSGKTNRSPGAVSSPNHSVFLIENASAASPNVSPQVDVATIVDRVELRLTNATLLPGTELHIVQDSTNRSGRSVIVIGANSSFSITNAVAFKRSPDRHPDEFSFDVVADLDISLLDSEVASNGQNLEVAGGSRITGRGIEFKSSNGASTAELKGVLGMYLKGGLLDLGDSRLALADGSSIQLRTFSFGHTTKLSGDAILNILGGSCYLNGNGVNLAEGCTMVASFALAQALGAPLMIKGSISDLSLTAANGQLDLKTAGYLNFGNGTHVIAKSVDLSVANRRLDISGKFSLIETRDVDGKLSFSDDSALFLGHESRVTFTDIVLGPKHSITGNLALSVVVTGGNVNFGKGQPADSVPKDIAFTLEEGSAVEATKLKIDSAKHHPISGIIERLYCNIKSGTLPFGARSFLVLRAGYIIVTNLQIPQDDDHFVGTAAVSVKALSGVLDFAQGDVFTLTHDCQLEAGALTIDTGRKIPVFGQIDFLEAATDGGTITFASGSLIHVTKGKLRIEPLVINGDVIDLAGTKAAFGVHVSDGTIMLGTMPLTFGEFELEATEGYTQGTLEVGLQQLPDAVLHLKNFLDMTSGHWWDVWRTKFPAEQRNPTDNPVLNLSLSHLKISVKLLPSSGADETNPPVSGQLATVSGSLALKIPSVGHLAVETRIDLPGPRDDVLRLYISVPSTTTPVQGTLSLAADKALHLTFDGYNLLQLNVENRSIDVKERFDCEVSNFRIGGFDNDMDHFGVYWNDTDQGKGIDITLHLLEMVYEDKKVHLRSKPVDFGTAIDVFVDDNEKNGLANQAEGAVVSGLQFILNDLLATGGAAALVGLVDKKAASNLSIEDQIATAIAAQKLADLQFNVGN
jgi:hypothetical protein